MRVTKAEWRKIVRDMDGNGGGTIRKATGSRPTPAALPAADTAWRAERGTVICQGVVLGRAVPWKSPTIGRHGGEMPTTGRLAMREWQRKVKRAAELLMAGAPAYGGPVYRHVVFYFAPTRTKIADSTNLLKAFEDAIQKCVIVNDDQVCGGSDMRIVEEGTVERVEFVVVAA